MTGTTKVSPRDPGEENSPLAEPDEGAATVILDTAATSCVWNGMDFPDGALVECDGVIYECAYGRWVKAG